MHLHRSFKPQECKTLLGLAMSRLKVLSNRKAIEVNQLKREVVQLLDSGQDWTTRIQVEHMIREENIMFAYGLLRVYCELIVTYLRLIESQKICPIDIKEAISSVIFASPRCAVVPELSKVCKQFSAKYGKDFVNSALELRPQSGVLPLLVEKLSSKAPDIETKIKVLKSIASDNGIKWEPKSFGESLQRPNEGLQNSLERSSNSTKDTNKPEVAFQSIQKHESVKSAIANETMTSAASDLTLKTKLQGPISFESAHLFARESCKPDTISQGNQMHEVEKAPLINDVEDSIKSSESISTGNAGIAFMQSQPQTIAQEKSPAGQVIDTSYTMEEDTVAREVNWGMGFKDVASAAESAERTTMTARIAAEFAGHENGSKLQHSACDERLPESLKLKGESASHEQVQILTKETGEMHKMNSGSNDQWNGAVQGRPEKAYVNDGSEKDNSRRISSSSVRLHDHCETLDADFEDTNSAKNYQDKDQIRMSVDFHDERGIETKYASHSYDSKRSLEETKKTHKVELTIASDSRRSSFSGDSGPTFDGDCSYSGDYVDFDNLGNNKENTFFQNQGSRWSDFPTYVEPLPKQRSESSSNDNSSLQVHSTKKSCIDENASNTGKYSLPLSSSDILAPCYDSDPEERKEVDCLDSLSQQTVKVSMHSENLDYADYEDEQVLKMEYLTGGLRNRGFPHPPKIRSSSEEKPLASGETPSTDSSRIKNVNQSISSFEILSKDYGQKQHKKHYIQKTSLSSDTDSSEEENLQATYSYTYSVKEKFDPDMHKTRKESLYRRSWREASDTIVNSDINTRVKSPDNVSPDTEMASAPLRHNMPPISDSSKEEIFDGEPRVEELDSKKPIRQSGPSNCDGEDSQSYQSYVRHSPKNIIMQSRRTRGPALNSKNNLLSKSPEKVEVSDIQTITQENIVDKCANSKFLPHESQIEGSFVTRSQAKESAQKGTSSDVGGGVGLVGLKPPKKLGAIPVSIFQPKVSWKKGMTNEDFESLPQESDEDSESSPRNLEHTQYSGRTKRTNSPASSSSEYIKKVEPPISSLTDSAISAQTSSLENEALKSTSSTSSEGPKKITTIKSSQGNSEKNLSVENKDKVKHIHPRLPDGDKLLAHFQALRSNVRK